ncbi:MAG: hypothetical protein Q8O06_02745 [Acetobacterium sp.]|nr:hypothetical protein [Acetobacterium sp.]
MIVKIKEILKNQNGSSLAFVIIIGVIIMIMVLSLMTVANSDFTFTQKTVESRQAYIDAKSVIEFGKIEINSRLDKLKIKQDALTELYAQKAAITGTDAASIVAISIKESQIQAKITEIDYYLNHAFISNYYIGYDGEGSSVVKTLKTVASEVEAIGILKVTPKPGDTSNITNYTFDIKTKGLRRVLNYQVGLNYEAANLSEGNVTIPPIPPDESGQWLDTKIVTKDKKDEIKCIIQKSGNQKAYDLLGSTLLVHVVEDSLDIGKDKANPNDNNVKFEWLQGKKLDLLAKNICFSAPFPRNSESVYQSQFTIKAEKELRFKEDYVQSSNAGLTNIMEAKDIIFEKNLVINNNDKLVITCKNLWINGDVLINALGGTNSSVTINAENIIVGNFTNNTGGNLKIGDKSNIIWNSTNSIMIRGDADFSTNVANPENRLTAKNISIGKGTNSSKVTVRNGTKIIWDCENFWLHGNMTTITSGSYQEFNNIAYFNAGDINLSNNCKLFVTGKTNSTNQMFVGGIIPLESNAYTVKIKNFELFQCAGNFGLLQSSLLELEALNVLIKGNLSLTGTGNLNISTQYFDVQGASIIKNSPLNIYGNGTLNARFEDYTQENSTVNITGAEKVILGSSVNLIYDNPPTLMLNIKSDSIYLDNSGGDIKKKTQLKYSGKIDGTGANFYFYPNQLVFKDWETDRTIKPGKYTGVTGNKLEDLPLEPGAYVPPPAWTPLAITVLNPTEPDGTGQSGGTGGTGGTTTGGSINPDPTQMEKYY